jgi:hypothetical protein
MDPRSPVAHVVSNEPLRGVRQQRRARAARVARVLWIVWAILLWNVVFDHVIVVAGRAYIAAAQRPGAPRANMDAYMRPAVTRALWTASAAAGAVLVIGLAAVRAASER